MIIPNQIGQRPRFYLLNEVEMDAMPEIPWLIPELIPGEAVIAVYGEVAAEFARELLHMFRCHERCAEFFDARELPPLTFAPQTPGGVSIVAVPTDTTPRHRERILASADCKIRAIDRVTGAVEKLRDAAPPKGKVVNLRDIL